MDARPLNEDLIGKIRKRYTDFVPSNLTFGPLHPKSFLNWSFKNIYCEECLGNCPSCNDTCCVFYYHDKAWQDSSKTKAERSISLSIIRNIQNAIVTGCDVSTFLECVRCDRRVCPNCCSLCAELQCTEIKCKRCCDAPCETREFQLRKPDFLHELPTLEERIKLANEKRIAQGKQAMTVVLPQDLGLGA